MPQRERITASIVGDDLDDRLDRPGRRARRAAARARPRRRAGVHGPARARSSATPSPTSAGALLGRHKLAPRDLAQQDRRGPGLRDRRRHAGRLVLVADLLPATAGSPASTACCSGSTVTIAAPIGDLFESLIKRDMGTKDTGTLFGAHGGALDRVDAALFALVAGYYVWLAAGMMDDEEKRDRQMMELLNELRVALPGRADPASRSCSPSRSPRASSSVTSTQKTLFYADAAGHGGLDGLPDRAERHAPPALPPARPRVHHRVGQQVPDRRPRVPGGRDRPRARDGHRLPLRRLGRLGRSRRWSRCCSSCSGSCARCCADCEGPAVGRRASSRRGGGSACAGSRRCRSRSGGRSRRSRASLASSAARAASTRWASSQRSDRHAGLGVEAAGERALGDVGVGGEVRAR